jgi:hypothetical protein
MKTPRMKMWGVFFRLSDLSIPPIQRPWPNTQAVVSKNMGIMVLNLAFLKVLYFLVNFDPSIALFPSLPPGDLWHRSPL